MSEDMLLSKVFPLNFLMIEKLVYFQNYLLLRKNYSLKLVT